MATHANAAGSIEPRLGEAICSARPPTEERVWENGYAEQTLYRRRHVAFSSVFDAFTFFSSSPLRGFFVILPAADFSDHTRFLHLFLEHAQGKFDVVIVHSNYH
jgi:hypothetical protein